MLSFLSKIGNNLHIFAYGGLFSLLVLFVIRGITLENKVERLMHSNMKLISEIEGLKKDTLYLRGSLREANLMINDIKKEDVDNNPDLINYFPDINTLR